MCVGAIVDFYAQNVPCCIRIRGMAQRMGRPPVGGCTQEKSARRRRHGCNKGALSDLMFVPQETRLRADGTAGHGGLTALLSSSRGAPD